MAPNIPLENFDPGLLGELDEALDRAAERHDTEDPIDVLGPPIRDDAEPTAHPPLSTTTEPAPGESKHV